MSSPDFSPVDRRAAEQLVREGRVEPLHLLPPDFGVGDVEAAGPESSTHTINVWGAALHRGG